ncbi:MAG: hypothetical protein Q7T53_01165 [Deltaproteobacteria bacterium]|nr:hypothetical protein [Deltaproteobacteria bacterium]
MDKDNSVDLKPVRDNLKDLYPAFLLFALAVACYWRMFDNYFYLDDTNGVFAGYLLSHDITKIFTYNFEAIYISPLRRVVVALSYIPNYLISGYDPWSYYLANLLLHFGNSLLVYLIVKKLSDNKNLALLTAVLFSTSLNKADAVMMIAHRTTLMGAFFALLSIFLYIRIIMEGYNRRLFLYTLLSFVAALGSYETGLVLPGIFIALGLVYKGRDFFKKELLLVNASFLSLVIILVLFLGLQPGAAIADTSLVGRIYHIFRNVLAVFPSFIIPPFVLQQPNEAYHSITTYFGWIELFSLVLIGLIVTVNLRIRDRLVIFGLIFFLIMAIPTSSVNWAYYPEYKFHRLRFSIGKYSYLSSFGYYIIAGTLLCKLYCYLSARCTRPHLIKAVSFLVLGTFIVFNISLLYHREKMWEFVAKMTKAQIDFLISLDIKQNHYHKIYSSGNDQFIYSKHVESLLRVIHKNTDITVQDFSKESKPEAGEKELLFITADGKMVAIDYDKKYLIKQSELPLKAPPFLLSIKPTRF